MRWYTLGDPGHYDRKLHTKGGEVSLQIPKLHSLPFETQIDCRANPYSHLRIWPGSVRRLSQYPPTAILRILRRVVKEPWAGK